MVASYQGRIQPGSLGGGRFQQYLAVKSHNSFAAVREINRCCKINILCKTAVTKQFKKWTTNSLTSRMFFSELYKIIMNKVTFLGFRGGYRPSRPPRSAPVSYSPLLWLVIDTTSKSYTHARRSHNSQLPQEK